jgi:uncharacterized repeat protein (TIGR01451 family)
MVEVNLRPFFSSPNRQLSWLLAVLLASTTLLVAARPPSEPPAPSLTNPTIAPDFGVLPLSFVPNAGQTDPAARFQAHSMGGTLFLTPNEVVLSLPVGGQQPAANLQQPAQLGPRSSFVHRPENAPASSVIRLRFEGANPTPQIAGTDRLPGIVNYFIGNDPAHWHTELPTYGEIVYRELYPGIDLHYAGTTGVDGRSLSLKGTYTAAPGADPTRIRWRYEGATSVSLDKATGDLLIKLPTQSPISNPQSLIPNLQSPITEHAPIAWQTINGQRVPVSVRYAVAANGGIGFALGTYNPAHPLIIDPTLTYSTYLGGSGYDYGWDIAVDDKGNAYVVGQTTSTDFPTKDPLQPDIGGGPVGDAFVVKLNVTGSGLVYATYLGGSHNDSGYGIAVDGEGAAYVTGDTLSFDFPIKNAAQPVSGGGGPFEGDAFITKLDPTGSALMYSTYLGGGGDELSYGVALDALGDAYVVGYTSSTDFPTVNAPQPDPAFGQGLDVYGDAFVIKVIGVNGGASGVYTWGLSTYLGGTQLDVARDIAVDALGTAYVTGHTRSDNFPTEKPVQPDYGGGSNFGRGDAFVTQVVSATGVYTWGYSTYLGGSKDEVGYGVAVDDSGDAYLTGETISTDFPTRNPLQGTFGGDRDAFVTKVVGAGGGYAWGYSTYLGGIDADMGIDVAVDADGRAHLTGYTFSPDFPATDDAYDGSCGTDGLCDSSGGDVFFTVLSDAGDGLAYSTFLGGSSTDFGHGIALDTSGDVYLTGFTYSADFPTTPNAYDRMCGTDGACNGFVTDAIVAKMTVTPDLSLTKGADPPANAPVTQGDTLTYTLVAANSGAQATNVIITDHIPSGTSFVPGSLTASQGNSGFDGAQVTVSLPTFATGATLTASFQVTVTTRLTTFITNQATLTADGLEPVGSNSVGHPVQGAGEPHVVYLPLMLKEVGAAPPPSGCAPYLVATIQVGDTPRGVAIDTTRDRAYVANYGSDSLSVIDTGGNTLIQTITGITSPTGVAYDPAHDLIWVTNTGSDRVTPVDASSLTPLPPVGVGDGPWGVAYDSVHDYVYVVNSLGDSVTVVDAATRVVVDTLSADLDQPFHMATNPVTGKAYVTNFGDHTITVLDGASVTGSVDLSGGNPTTQPYGVTVDETRDLVYVAAVDSHRVAVIGTDAGGTPDQAVNPEIGPPGDGGHLWVTTSTADGSEANQALLIPKGWDGYFSYPAPYDVGANPSEGIAVDRDSDRVYVTSGATPGTVAVLGDGTDACLVPFGVDDDGFGFEVFTIQD